MRSSFRLLSRHPPSVAYNKLVKDNLVREDARQKGALITLDELWHDLGRSSSSPVTKKSSLSSWFGRKDQPESALRPNNVYLYGTVGTGKSMIMDLLYDSVPGTDKMRVHFHEFMLDVHRKIHEWRRFERKSSDDDPIEPVAVKLRAKARLLCFDEFQVTDVADAMILKRLFEQMMDKGMRFVLTSNRAPEELYKGGLNRPLFEPFITGVLRTRFKIVDLSSSNDYRLVGQKSLKSVHLFPLSSADAKRQFEEAFLSLTHKEKPQSVDLTAFGSRKVHVPLCARGVALFTWKQLIDSSLGASDYLAISRAFHTVMLSGVPRMSIAQSHLARRFITCVDTLYERRCKLILLADGQPNELFPNEKEAQGASQEEVFAFQRTVSRLIEMQSVLYLEQPHRSDHVETK